MSDAPVPDTQLVLLPEGPVELHHDPCLPIAALRWSAGVKPARALVESVKRLGVLEPIIVRNADAYEVVDGRRRVLAALEAELTTIPAVIAYGLEGPTPASLLLMLNEQRRPNPLAELEAIEELLAAGAGEAEIGRATGLTVATIRQRLRLAQAHPTLRQLAADGILALGILERAAKLPSATQAALVSAHHAGEKLTSALVHEVMQVRRTDAVADLPPALFELPDYAGPPVLDEVAIRADERERIAAYLEKKHRLNPPMKLTVDAIRRGDYREAPVEVAS